MAVMIVVPVAMVLAGQDALQGSFADAETGSGFSSCAEYATRTGIPFHSPSPPLQAFTSAGRPPTGRDSIAGLRVR